MLTWWPVTCLTVTSQYAAVGLPLATRLHPAADQCGILSFGRHLHSPIKKS